MSQSEKRNTDMKSGKLKWTNSTGIHRVNMTQDFSR